MRVFLTVVAVAASSAWFGAYPGPANAQAFEIDGL